MTPFMLYAYDTYKYIHHHTHKVNENPKQNKKFEFE